MDTWWIDEPVLLGSCNPSDADLEQLRAEGFSVIVSLLIEDAQPPGYDLERARVLGFERHNIPVRDFHPPTLKQLDEFLKVVRSLPAGSRTILHCQAGVGRTGTFAATYLIANGKPVSDAIACVRRARPHAIETAEQEAVLHEFGRHLSPRSTTRGRSD